MIRGTLVLRQNRDDSEQRGNVYRNYFNLTYLYFLALRIEHSRLLAMFQDFQQFKRAKSHALSKVEGNNGAIYRDLRVNLPFSCFGFQILAQKNNLLKAVSAV